MTTALRIAAPCGDVLGESATWSVREKALYWIDIRAPALHRLDPASGTHRTWPLPELCGAVVPMTTGVLLALRRTLAHFDPDTARLTPLVEVEPAALGNRLNEAKCDCDGRLWVGSMRDFAAATTGSLYRADAALRPTRVIADVTIPNSLGWSPDGRTMYFADTADGAIRAYDIDRTTGAIGRARVFIAADALPGRPDGCTVDADGHVWTTRFGAGLVVRVAPDGRLTGSIALPTAQPTSCALGGTDLRTLYVTTARQRLDPAALRAQPAAGHLFAQQVDVPGLPGSEFAVTVSTMMAACG